MKKLLVALIALVFLVGGLFAIRLLSGDEDTWICKEGSWVKHGNPSAPMPTSPCGPGVEATPERVTEAFFNWWLQGNGNKLSTGAYKTSEYLTEGYRQKIDAILASFDGGGGLDPVLCAQDTPSRIVVENPVVEGNIARVSVGEYFGDSRQDITAALVREGSDWKISDITCETSLTPAAVGNSKTAIIYFSNPRRSMGSTECGLVFGVERMVSSDNYYRQALNHLFLGPTPAEQSQGYSSFFSKKTANILKGLRIVGTTAYVNLEDVRTLIPNASASCGSKDFFAQVGETLKHDRKITKVIYAINGDPESFYEWMQLGCSPENNGCDATPFK